MGRPSQVDPGHYLDASPLYHANQIKAATLIFHGTDDFLPFRIVNNFHDQIQANGAPVNLMAFVGEGHGLKGRSSQIVAAQAMLEWFRKYLAVPAPTTVVPS